MNDGQPPNRKIAVFFSDTHGGHRLGLLRPGTELFDEDEEGNPTVFTPRLTATQKWLWKKYTEDWQAVFELAGDDPVVIVHNGDLCHGNKHPSRLVSNVPANQIIIATANLSYPLEILPNVTAMRIVAGTGAHDFGFGTAELLVTRQFASTGFDVSYLNHGLLDIGGVTVDVAHHGPSPGIRNWTAGNQLRYYVRSLMSDALEDGDLPPGVVIRGHYHTFAMELVQKITKRGRFQTWGIILPSYCGLSAYSRQATRSAYRVGCGLVALEIVGGKLVDIHPFHRLVDLRTKEAL